MKTQTKIAVGSVLSTLGALGVVLSLLLGWTEAARPWGFLLGFIFGLLAGLGVTLGIAGLIERRRGNKGGLRLQPSWGYSGAQYARSRRYEMDPKDVLLDMLENYAFVLHRTIKDLPKAALQWQPDPEANNIVVTVWHVCRALDVLKLKIIENRPVQDQLWYAMGWASKTRYAPAGLGIGGFGNLAVILWNKLKQFPCFLRQNHWNTLIRFAEHCGITWRM